MTLSDAQTDLRKQADPSIAEKSKRFCKTGKGEYGENYRFLGVRVPTIRTIAKSHRDADIKEILSILHSPYHEERLLALIMMVHRFEKGDETQKAEVYKTYLKHSDYIDGWDLVDSSAYQIVGGYLLSRPRGKLLELAHSSLLWDRRIAIIATYLFIKHKQYDDTLMLAEQLLDDKEDLMHKAVGWMLREVGNRDKAVEVAFLNKHYKRMPRTMLRYAIEKFNKNERADYLSGTA